VTRVHLPENVVFRSFGSEMVLLNLKTGRYHGLKGSGGRMLEVLAEQGDVEAAARQVADEYEQDLQVVASDMERLCQELAERSLIVFEDGADGP
jgi:hypothetical protein